MQRLPLEMDDAAAHLEALGNSTRPKITMRLFACDSRGFGS
jgi:hypothetical protein